MSRVPTSPYRTVHVGPLLFLLPKPVCNLWMHHSCSVPRHNALGSDAMFAWHNGSSKSHHIHHHYWLFANHIMCHEHTFISVEQNNLSFFKISQWFCRQWLFTLREGLVDRTGCHLDICITTTFLPASSSCSSAFSKSGSLEKKGFLGPTDEGTWSSTVYFNLHQTGVKTSSLWLWCV